MDRGLSAAGAAARTAAGTAARKAAGPDIAGRSAAAPAAAPAGPWAGPAWSWPRVPSLTLLALGVTVQLAVALLSVRAGLDARIFQAAGYLVGTGHSPYVPADLSAVFHDPLYAALPTIGYPPPWPLLLGGIYRLSSALQPDLGLYNAAIKLPAVAAAVAVAYLAAAALHNLGATPQAVRRAWLALLFNPLVVFVAAAWGQIDALVAVLALAALLLLAAGRLDISAVLLALAVCVKPTAAPLLLASLAFLGAASIARALRYALVFALGAVVFYVLPFLALGWDGSPARAANAQISMAGAMSYTTIGRALARSWRAPLLLEGHWWLLGLLWIPALLAAVLLARRVPRDLAGLLALGAGLTLVFFLCRTWLSESNVVLVLAPVLILAALGRVDRRLFTALWAVALAFAVANASPVQLLWAFAPGLTDAAVGVVRAHPDVTLIVRAALVVVWQVAGWWTVVACLRFRGAEDEAPQPNRAGAPADAVAPSDTVAPAVAMAPSGAPARTWARP